VWLPGPADPVPAGRLITEGEIITFNYGSSYLNLIRARFTDPDATLRELFTGSCSTSACPTPTTTPAITPGRAASDADPGLRSVPPAPARDTAAQGMAITRDGRRESRFATCLAAAEIYHLTRAQAADIIDHQVTVITEQWAATADAARLTAADRDRM
jgi:serine/threonine-protein kinase HipA